MDKILDALSLGWVGSLLGVVGLVAAFVTYLKTRQRTLLMYARTSERLLGLGDEGNLPADIAVKYKDQDIPRLSRSIITFWNEGEKTLHAADVVVAEPVRISVNDDGVILAATPLKVSRDVTRIYCLASPTDKSVALLKFDFLDQYDGATIEILHTSEEPAASVLGTVRGLPRGILYMGSSRSSLTLPDRWAAIMKAAMSPKFGGLLCVLTGLFAVVIPIIGETIGRPLPDPGPNALYAGGGFYIFIGIVNLWMWRRKYPKSLMVDKT